MSAKRTPAIAIWLLTQFGCSPDTEILIGDIVEQYEVGRSRFWLCWQVLSSLGSGFLEEVLSHKGRIVRVLFMSWSGFAIFQWMITASEIVRLGTLDPSTFEKHVVNGQVVGFYLPTPWYFFFPTAMILYMVLCMAVAGQIAARVGGEHRKAAVLTYAVSFLFVFSLDAGPSLFFGLLDATGSIPWKLLGKIALYFSAILLGGLVTRSSVSRSQPELS
jgi:hypothetical protein